MYGDEYCGGREQDIYHKRKEQKGHALKKEMANSLWEAET